MPKYKITLFLIISTILQACNAQSAETEEPCICLDELNPVCVLLDSGEILEIDNNCLALCQGYNPEQIIICQDSNENFAQVVSVLITGNSGNYSMNVGVLSPDTGCDKYANWWEVITIDGELLYRRILAHSHTPPQSKQPFVRSGGPIKMNKNQKVIIRAHMNTSGYGNQVYQGSVNSGFEAKVIEKDFAIDLEDKQPQPGTCPF